MYYVFYVNPKRKATGNPANCTQAAGFLLSVEMTSGSRGVEGHQQKQARGKRPALNKADGFPF
ncbi:MAG: hypothetical protein ACXWMH_06945 [Syntrophales bacterium]